MKDQSIFADGTIVLEMTTRVILDMESLEFNRLK